MAKRKSFSKEVINKVWNDAGGEGEQKIFDAFGTEIARAAYGDEGSAFGWDIDHITPLSRGGDNDISNLRPLHIENNRFKGNR